MDCGSPAENRRYRKDIDGLRAIAVLSVFLFHLQPQLLPGGFLGVDVFFVISGYLISSIIVREHHQQRFSFANFYARRVKRIFPALFVVLAMSASVALVLMKPETYKNFMISGRYAAAQLSNFFFSQKVDYFSEGFSGQPLLHTWSLGVEEQFYIFWPLLIYLCFRFVTGNKTPQQQAISTHGVAKEVPAHFENGGTSSEAWGINLKVATIFILLGLISFWLCYQLTQTNYNRAFYMFYTRAFEFCIGGLLALKIVPKLMSVRANMISGVVALTLLGYSFVFINEAFLGGSFLQFGVLVPCIGSALLIHTHSKDSIVNRLLSMRFPVYVGKISYSLYLYHWPVIIFWKLYTNNPSLSALESVIIILVSFLLATLSYKYVEQPARQSKITNPKALVSALAVIIIFSTAFNGMEGFDDSGWRITRYHQETSSESSPLASDCKKTARGGVQFYQCQETSLENTPTVALLGDSHAPHFLQATTSWAKKSGYNVKYNAVPGCPMERGDVSIPRTIFVEKYTKRCERSLSLLRKNIVDDPRVEIVMMAQRYDLFYDGKGYLNNVKIITFKDQDGNVVKDHSRYYEGRLSETVDITKAAGKRVVLLKQIPINLGADSCDWQPLIFKMFNRERECEYDVGFISEWQQPSIDFIDKFCQDHELATFDPALIMDRPYYNGMNLYTDRDHLNEYGRSFLVPYFEQYMETLLAPMAKTKNQYDTEIIID